MEFVYVVPRTELFPDCTPHGLVPFDESSSEAEFTERIERHGFFVERDAAERNPDWKQVIPYTVVVRIAEASAASPSGWDVFLLQRTKAGGDARLYDKLSIGVGGHVNPVDLPGPDAPAGVGRRNPIPAATRREVMEEELDIEGAVTLRPVGILNDDTNPVGAVHVGLVQVLTVEGTVKVRETEQLEGRFVAIAELQRLLAKGANFETWSSLLVEQLERLLPLPCAT